jgi:chromosome partitioning protein
MFDLDKIFSDIIQHLLHEGGSALVASIAIAVISALGFGLRWAFKKFRAAWRYFRRLEAARAAVARVNRRGILREGPGLWLAEPISIPPTLSSSNHRNRHVLAIGNLKGGVGKTTLAANIGAYLAPRLTKPILLVDLDFQGSLSSMAAPADWLPQDGYDSRSTSLIGGECSASELAQTIKTAAGISRLKLITSYYDLAQAENRLMVNWLVSDRKRDVRFTLAELFSDEEVQNAFGLIILDLPPRLTTASIQALCSASHLLIPTILDRTSADAVYSFIDQVEILRESTLCQHIRHLGVVGTVVENIVNYSIIENELRDRLLSRGNCGSAPIELLPTETYLLKSKFFKQAAGRGIAYAHAGQAAPFDAVRASIETLGQRVKDRMGLICRDGM